MKKIILISLSGIFIGSFFAYYMFSNINETVASVMEEQSIVKAFQIGVFNIYDNAKNLAESYEASFIYQDEDKYRVFLAIYQDSEIIDYMLNYYKSKNINVYLKEINTNESFIKELKKYENLLKKTNNKENYISANKNILKKFGDLLWAI